MAIDKKNLLVSSFIGSALIFTALAAYRPGDFGHVVSETTSEGGKSRHGANFSYGIGRCSVLVTSKVSLDCKDDLKISVEGANPPPFEIIGRNPSVFNLGIHAWPRMEGDTIYGVQKDKIAFYVVFMSTEKDPVCGMWVNSQNSGDTKDFKGKSYHFCSVDCKNSFAGNPANFAEKPMPPERCEIILTDSQRRRVLTVPVDFSYPGSAVSTSSESAGASSSHCSGAGVAPGSGRPSGAKSYRKKGAKE